MSDSGKESGPATSPPPRDFRLYWSADAFDRLGTQISGLALPLLLLDAGASTARAGMMVTLAGAGGLLAGPAAAPFADARARRAVLLASSLTAAAAMGWAAATAASHRLPLPMLVGALLVERVAASCYGAAASGSIARLVPPAGYPRAVARLQAGEQAGLVAGPALAGVLLRAARWLPFLADAVSYLVAAACVAAIRTDLAPRGSAGPDAGPAGSAGARGAGARPAGREAFTARVTRGARFALATPFLRFVLVWSGGVNLLLAMLTYDTVFALHRADGSTPVGLVLALAGAAGLAGALLAPAAAARFGGRTLVVAISWTTVPVAAALARAGRGWPYGTLLAAVTLLVPAVAVVLQSRAVLVIPQDLQARVGTVLGTVSAAAGLAAPGLAGVLAGAVGTARTDLLCAGLLALLALYATAAPAVRAPAAPAAPRESATAGGRA